MSTARVPRRRPCHRTRRDRARPVRRHAAGRHEGRRHPGRSPEQPGHRLANYATGQTLHRTGPALDADRGTARLRRAPTWSLKASARVWSRSSESGRTCMSGPQTPRWSTAGSPARLVERLQVSHLHGVMTMAGARPVPRAGSSGWARSANGSSAPGQSPLSVRKTNEAERTAVLRHEHDPAPPARQVSRIRRDGTLGVAQV